MYASDKSTESRYGAGALTSGGITKAVVQREALARWETGVDMLQLVADGPVLGAWH